MKGLKESITKYTISAIIFIIFAVILTVILTINLINNSVRSVYSENGLVIDMEPKINRRLDKLSDVDGLTSTTNKINVTNNDSVNKRYQILLSPINDYEKDIRVSVNNMLIRYLANFEKDGNDYILMEDEVTPGHSVLNQVGMWQSIHSEEGKLGVDFKLKVKIIGE